MSQAWKLRIISVAAWLIMIAMMVAYYYSSKGMS